MHIENVKTEKGENAGYEYFCFPEMFSFLSPTNSPLVHKFFL